MLEYWKLIVSGHTVHQSITRASSQYTKSRTDIFDWLYSPNKQVDHSTLLKQVRQSKSVQTIFTEDKGRQVSSVGYARPRNTQSYQD